MLCSVTTHNPATWATYIHAMGGIRAQFFNIYCHESLSFRRLGYQPPLFPKQETELAMPLVQHHVRHCHRAWIRMKEALLQSVARQRH